MTSRDQEFFEGKLIIDRFSEIFVRIEILDIHTENELYRGSLTKYREKIYADNIEVS